MKHFGSSFLSGNNSIKSMVLMSLCSVAFIGCGSGEKMSTQTPEEFAQDVKTQVEDFIASAQKDSKTAAANLEIMMESLTAYAD